MSPDMHVETCATRVGVLLRLVEDQPAVGKPLDRLTAWAYLLGIESDEALAKELGVVPRTLRRARQDGIIGEKLMAAAVLFFQRRRDELAKYGIEASLDALFVVTEKAAA